MSQADLKKAIELMGGREPVNELGSCFDAAAFTLLGQEGEPNPGAEERLCHGIGISNMPGQEGLVMGHAWVEFTTPKDKVRLALDPIWNIFVRAEKFRADFKMSYVVEYTAEQAHALWSPGPWDEKITAVVKRNEETK